MENNAVITETVKSAEGSTQKANPKYVNPYLSWGLLIGEFVIIGIIAAIVFL